MKKSSDTESAHLNAEKNNARTANRRVPRTRRRWRVEIVNENTLSKVWSIRLTGIKARLALLAAVASIVSLVVVIFTFTPVGKWLWGERDLRKQYIDMSLRLDSLNAVASVQDAYAANIRAIISGLPASDTVMPTFVPVASDTLLSSSEQERRFVERFEAENRFNLSVLSPIAAEGMIFESPVRVVGEGGPVMAVYRGTVIGLFVGPDGKYNLVVQHPNDFISSYGALSDVYVGKGAKVVAGQRIGAAKTEPVFELWRGGTHLDPEKYITFPIPSNIDK